MSDKTQAKDTPKSSTAKDDLGVEQVQQTFDEANEKGYFGETTDPTPNENYTLQGVAGGKPTPETDEKMADAARKARG